MGTLSCTVRRAQAIVKLNQAPDDNVRAAAEKIFYKLRNYSTAAAFEVLDGLPTGSMLKNRLTTPRSPQSPAVNCLTVSSTAKTSGRS